MKKYVLPIILGLLLTSCTVTEKSSTESSSKSESTSEEVSSNENSSEQTSSSKEQSSNEESSSSEKESSSSSSIQGEGIKLIDAPTPSGDTGVYYQLLVYSFADGDGDGIGDFKGIVDHLDYLSNLGISTIWLSPIHPAASYHAYDVIDYESINSEYEVTVSGTKYDLQYLVNAAHKKDINIVMDMVLNHTSNQCEWYKSTHKDWYSSENKFGGSMPELNYDITAVRTKIKEICGDYLKKGVDGFRLDAAYWIYNSGSDRDSKNYAWWQEFCNAMEAINDDVYIIGEVLDDDTSIMARYNQCGFDVFDFAGNGKLEKAVQVHDAKGYAKYVQNYQDDIERYRDDAVPTHVLSNHDIGRFSNEYYSSGYTIDAYNRLALANTLNILTPGNSYIYYGDELGLVGECPNGYADMSYRTPMPFASGATNSKLYFENFKGDGATTNHTVSGKNADQDADSSTSLYTLAKKAVAIKNAVDDLKDGEVTYYQTPVTSLGAFKVGDSTVLFNTNDTTLDITLSSAPNARYGIVPTGTVSASGNVLHLPTCATIVLDGNYTITSVEGGQETIIPLDDGTEVTSEVSGTLILHYKNTNTWGNVYCYTWVGNNQYFGSWPGTKMTDDGNGYWTITLNKGASNIIFNNGSGQQTENLHRNEEGEYWYVNNHWYGQQI